MSNIFRMFATQYKADNYECKFKGIKRNARRIV